MGRLWGGQHPWTQASPKSTKTSYSIPEYNWDELPETRKWNRLFDVNTDFQNGEPTYSTVKCFTDGSMLNNNAGSGHCVMIGKRLVEKDAFPLGKYATVFQAEIMAINRACTTLAPYARLGKITIFSDSQAVLLALNNNTVHSKVVLATYND